MPRFRQMRSRREKSQGGKRFSVSCCLSGHLAFKILKNIHKKKTTKLCPSGALILVGGDWKETSKTSRTIGIFSGEKCYRER